MTEGRPASFPWLLVASSVLFAVLLVYLLFSAYLPTKKRMLRLEAELRTLYASEARLQTRMAQQEQQDALREQQLRALDAERASLARRIDELEREVEAARSTRPAAPARRR